MRTAENDFNTGVYRLISKGDGTVELVYTYSLTGNKHGSDGMNCDFVLEQKIKCDSFDKNCDLARAIREHKITRAIWYGHDNYITPRKVLKNGFVLIVINDDM